jgi:hypothetical protein
LADRTSGLGINFQSAYTSDRFSQAGSRIIVLIGNKVLNGWTRPSPMKNPYDVLRAKEQEMIRIRKEMEALRLAARLLGAEDPGRESAQDQPKVPRVVQMP